MIRGRRSVVTAVLLLVMVSIIIFMSNAGDDTVNVKAIKIEKHDKQSNPVQNINIDTSETNNGEYGRKEKQVGQSNLEQIPVDLDLETPFMPKMANETLKAQLGNSAWRLFHTILARYPKKPTELQKTTLDQYIKLFAQVYPCGDCARHFQQLLLKYPPQVSSRQNAAMWGCMIHNKVNDRLKKPIYDCTTILEDYDCGCAKDEEDEDNETKNHLNNIKVDQIEGLQKGG